MDLKHDDLQWWEQSDLVDPQTCHHLFAHACSGFAALPHGHVRGKPSIWPAKRVSRKVCSFVGIELPAA